VETVDDRPFEIRRVRWRINVARLAMTVAIIPVAMAAFRRGTLQRGDALVAAFLLVWMVREAYDSYRLVARADAHGITYAAGWTTRRVAFADVVAWEIEAANQALMFTTHDDGRWWVNLRGTTPADRDRIIAHLKPRLPPAVVHEGLDVTRPILAEATWYVVIMLASLQVVSWFPVEETPAPAPRPIVSIGRREPERHAPSPKNETAYGPYPTVYRAPFHPEPSPLILIEPCYSGPWDDPVTMATTLLGIAINGCLPSGGAWRHG
jgi:hypothetical protein